MQRYEYVERHENREDSDCHQSWLALWVGGLVLNQTAREDTKRIQTIHIAHAFANVANAWDSEEGEFP